MMSDDANNNNITHQTNWTSKYWEKWLYCCICFKCHNTKWYGI